MSRNDTVSTPALFGLAGTLLLSVGGVLASVSVAALDLRLGGTLAVPVWGTFAYVAMEQFANGIYTIVEDRRDGSATPTRSVFLLRSRPRRWRFVARAEESGNRVASTSGR